MKNLFINKLGFDNDTSMLDWLADIRAKSKTYQGVYFGKTVTFLDVGIWDKYSETFFSFLRGLFSVLLLFFNYKMILFVIRGTHFINGETNRSDWRSLSDGGAKTKSPFSKGGK